MADIKNIEKILYFLSEKPVSVHQIVCTTKLHTRTVKKYLQIIQKVQEAPKIKSELHGLRILFRKS